MKDIVKPAWALFAIALIASLCLGFVYDITKAPIEKQQQETKNMAMREILQSATDFESRKIPEQYSDKITSIDVGFSEDKAVGYVVGVSPKGYGGSIDMLVGIDVEGIIRGVKIVNHSETPGLGANATNAKFIDQYTGKSKTLNVVKAVPTSDNEIEAITSATITSKAVTLGVNDALDFYNDKLKGAEQK